MGKGSGRRPCQVPKEQYDKNFEAVFGKKKLNVMSDEDREELEPLDTSLIGDVLIRMSEVLKNDRDREAGGNVPSDGHEGRSIYAESKGASDKGETAQNKEHFWTGPGYRGEYNCPHGVGHGNHVHGCCEFQCCSRDDFPLKKTGQGYEDGVRRKEGRCRICGQIVYSHRGEMPTSCSSCASDF